MREQNFQPFRWRYATPDDFAELTPDETRKMRELIRFYMRHGVPAGQVFEVDFYGTDDEVFSLQIQAFWRGDFLYWRNLLIFGWRPRFAADVFDFSKIAQRISKSKHAPEEGRQESVVAKIQTTIGDPRNWRNPPPPSAVFFFTPLFVEKV